MSGFLPSESLRNKAASEPWMKSDTDKMLDLYFAGAHPNRIAQELERNPKAIKRYLEQFTYNERYRAAKYEPFRRISRQGKRFTENESLIWKAHQERKIPLSITARLLQRNVSEIDGNGLKGQIVVARQKQIAPTLDIIWAHRYMYFVWEQPILSDDTYDTLVQEEIEYGGGEKAFATIKNHAGWPEYICSLALYLSVKHEKEKE